jgi:hypothetical protein
MQVPPQYAWPAGHVHALFTQLDPPAQTVPHAPQLALSFVRLTHEPLGHCVGVAPRHMVMHLPPPHSHCEAPGGKGMAVQSLPHVPQLARLDARLTHWPLHDV